MNFVLFVGSLFLMCLFGSIAYYNHWWPYWIASGVCLGAFIYLVVKSWKAAKATQ